MPCVVLGSGAVRRGRPAAPPPRGLARWRIPPLVSPLKYLAARYSPGRNSWASKWRAIASGTTEYPASVSWEGPGEPIVLKVRGPDGEVAVPLLPKRALELAQELTRPAVQSIKTSQWGPGWPG